MRARRCTRERRLVLPITSRSPLATRRSRRNSGSSFERRRLARSATRRRRAGCRAPSPAAPAPSGPDGPVLDVVGAGAEQDEVPVAQPLEERRRLLDLLGGAHAARPPARPPPCARPSRASPRSRPTASCSSAERLAHGRDERLALLARELPLELEPHDRLAPARLARIGDAHDAPLGVALDADDRMQQQAHAVAGALHGGAHRVDQERRVGHVDLERRAGGRRVDDAHGDRLAGRARRRSRRGRPSGGRAPRGRTCAAARAGCGRAARARSRSGARCGAGSRGSRSALRARPGADARRGVRSRAHAIRSSHARGGPAARSPCAPARPPRSRRPPAARRSRRCGRCASARSSAAGRAGARRAGRRSRRPRRPAGMRRPSSRQAAYTPSATESESAKIAVGPLGRGEQVARERLRAVEAVLAGVQLRLESEALRPLEHRLLGAARGRALDRPREHADAAVPALGEVLEHGAHRALVVEQDLAGRGGAGHALADADGRHALGDLAPALGERADRRDDEGVDAPVVRARARAPTSSAGSPSASAISSCRPPARRWRCTPATSSCR